MDRKGQEKQHRREAKIWRTLPLRLEAMGKKPRGYWWPDQKQSKNSIQTTTTES
jgi:hypothetical protein